MIISNWKNEYNQHSALIIKKEKDFDVFNNT